MRKPNQGLNQLVQIFLVLSLVSLMGFQTISASAKATEPPEESSQDRAGIQTDSAGLAAGETRTDRDGYFLVFTGYCKWGM